MMMSNCISSIFKKISNVKINSIVNLYNIINLYNILHLNKEDLIY